jgi:hypothetical protein
MNHDNAFHYLSGQPRTGKVWRVCPLCRHRLSQPPEEAAEYPTRVLQVWYEGKWSHLTEMGQEHHEREVAERVKHQERIRRRIVGKLKAKKN